jgi:hypothetical protein
MKKEKKVNPVSSAGSVITSTYDKSVIMRAAQRGGKCPNLKGHINEVLTVDKINRNPLNILKGKKAALTKSSTAVRDDIIVKQGEKVVKRIQVKDTPKSITDTVRRVKNGQYRGTNLVGTKETAAAYEKAVASMGKKGKTVTQKMSSNGISSDTTAFLSKQALGGSLKGTGKQLIKASSKSAAFGGVISGGISGISNLVKCKKGEISGKEAAMSTAKETVYGGIASGVGAACDAVTTIAVASTPLAPAAKLIGTAANVGSCMAVDAILRKGEKIIKRKSKEA